MGGEVQASGFHCMVIKAQMCRVSDGPRDAPIQPFWLSNQRAWCEPKSHLVTQPLMRGLFDADKRI